MNDIGSLTRGELGAALSDLPAFRAGQVYGWIHKRNCDGFGEMTDLSATLREQLTARFRLGLPEIQKKLVSAVDNTVKYLYTLEDGQRVETVVMRYHHGNSVCLSTQAGCRMGCRFCASTLNGLARNLTPYEILGQLYAAERDLGERIDSVVLMGIGEPLDNYDNVLRFLTLLSDGNGHNLSLRHVSLSTCGLVDAIDRLARERLQLTLSVSLHAPNDERRRRLMPVANRWSVDELLAACWRYSEATGRRISFEYALVAGENDSPECARELAGRLAGHLAHVNLIPVNPVKERGLRPSDRRGVAAFQKILEDHHITATVRRRLGSDINAACGQLRQEEASLCTERQA